MAAGVTSFKMEKFRGDDTDNITDYLKKFERYVKVCGIKDDQKYDLLCLQVEGRAQWYIDSLQTPPADYAAMKASLTGKFNNEKQIKMNVFNLKKLECESINDFVFRVEKETKDMKLTEELQVQIAVGGLHPTVQSAISSHGPKTLDEVRTLANRVQQPIAAVSAVAAPTSGTLDQILTLLKTLTTQDKQEAQQPVHRRDPAYFRNGVQ